MKTTLLILWGILCTVPAVAQMVPKAATGNSYVGVMVQEIDSERARALKLPNEAGVEVTRVEPDSPADRAGLKTGDAIMQYNGQRVEGMEQFSRLVRETPAGRDVKLDVSRNGAPQSMTVKVASRRVPQALGGFNIPSTSTDRLELRMPDMPHSFMSWRSSALGMECETLEGQFAQYFGVKEGVLVRSVSKGSAAEKAGIKAGDVILRVDDSRVVTPAEISSRIRSTRSKPVAVVLMRDHKEINVSVTVEDDDRGDMWWQQNSPPVAPNGRIH